MKTFEAPEFIEIKMDAEIGSYQEDTDPLRDPYFVNTEEQAAER
jgi:hypothetical protein